MPACASGAASEAMMPTVEKANGPTTFSTRHPRSAVTPGGTARSGHITETSSRVAVRLTKSPAAQLGSGDPAGRRHTA